MQLNETLKPKMPEVHLPLGAEKEAPGWLNKLGTAVADMGRDIATANDMAKDKFDGDSALMHVARGGMTTMIGIGFDAALENVLSTGIKEGKLFVGRIPLPLQKKTIAQLDNLSRKHPRERYFIESATKNIIAGLAYNTTAYFSGHALPSAEPEHFLGSLVASAVEAAGPKGKEGVQILKTEPIPGDAENSDKLLKIKSAEAKDAYEAALDPRHVVETSRKKFLEDLESKQASLKRDWQEARDLGAPAMQLTNDLAHPLSGRKMKRARSRIETAVAVAGYKAEKQRQALYEKAANAETASNISDYLLKHSIIDSKSTNFNWKAEAQKYIKYANPATLLGIDWMADGVTELVKNTVAVRKVRKEKGGLVGKKVEMPKKDEWRKPWEQRGKYENKGKWQGNKDKVYYGKSNWNDNKQKEEVDLAKFD